jgi:hypothetical protein
MNGDVFDQWHHLPCGTKERDLIVSGLAGAYGLSRCSWFVERLPGVIQVQGADGSVRRLWTPRSVAELVADVGVAKFSRRYD